MEYTKLIKVIKKNNLILSVVHRQIIKWTIGWNNSTALTDLEFSVTHRKR